MGTHYTCTNQVRRALVAQHATINGIDYLEVVDAGAPLGVPRQRVLLVHAFKPLPLTLDASNVRLTGGVRIPHVHVQWAAVAAAITHTLVDSGLLSEAEYSYYTAQPQPDALLVVRTASAGDFSPYTLDLVSSGASSLSDLDPILSQVTFSFKVDCPSDFDCDAETAVAAEPAPSPRLQYLAKDYQSFRQLMLDRMATLVPQWLDRSPADLGVTLVELLAQAADQVSYYQDAAATEAYLGTARSRVSVRRHARLLDYDMHDGCNSRTWVCLEAAADGLALLPVNATGTRTQFLTRCTTGVTVDTDDLAGLLAAATPAIFEPLHGLVLYRAHNRIRFYTWGEAACTLPAGATSATLLAADGLTLNLAPGHVLILEEALGPSTGQSYDADLSHRHPVRLTKVTPGVDPLTSQDIVAVEWDAQDALPFPLALSAPVAGALALDLAVARGNAVLVDHGRTVTETLPAALGAGARFRPNLQEPALTYAVTYRPGLHVTQAGTGLSRVQGAAALVAQDPRQAAPQIALQAPGGERWRAQRHLLASDRFAQEFVVELERDGTAWLRFGDDLLGKSPDTGTVFAATYRTGNGTVGNVGADAVVHIVGGPGSITAVRNPLPARGGVAPESMDEVRHYAPVAFRTQERAVTPADYAEVAQRHPEIQRAVATLRWTGSWYTMYVTADRKAGRAVDDAFKLELRAFLERYRLAGYDLEVEAPRDVPLDIRLKVYVADGYFRSDVAEALLTAFSNQALPDGTRGFFHPDNFTFGQTVYLAPVVAAAMQVAGVAWVDISADPGCQPANRFQRWGEPERGELSAGQITMHRLEIPRLDNDPNAPEHGKLSFEMRGGL